MRIAIASVLIAGCLLGSASMADGAGTGAKRPQLQLADGAGTGAKRPQIQVGVGASASMIAAV